MADDCVSSQLDVRFQSSIINAGFAWWRHDMEILAALRVLLAFCWLEQAVEQTLELPLIWVIRYNTCDILQWHPLNHKPESHHTLETDFKHISTHWPPGNWVARILCKFQTPEVFDILRTLGHGWFNSRLILDLRPANERRRYKVTPSLIGWAQT